MLLKALEDILAISRKLTKDNDWSRNSYDEGVLLYIGVKEKRFRPSECE